MIPDCRREDAPYLARPSLWASDVELPQPRARDGWRATPFLTSVPESENITGAVNEGEHLNPVRIHEVDQPEPDNEQFTGSRIVELRDYAPPLSHLAE